MHIKQIHSKEKIMKNRLIIATSIALALSSQYAVAGSIADSYLTGDTLTAAKMDNIKAAVNDNDTRTTANAAAIGNNTTTIGIIVATDIIQDTNIGTNTAATTSNTTGVATNAADIGALSLSITTNNTDIATNAADIATNAANITTKQSNVTIFDDAYTGASLVTNVDDYIYPYFSATTFISAQTCIVTTDLSFDGDASTTGTGPFVRVAVERDTTNGDDGSFGLYPGAIAAGEKQHISRTASINVSAGDAIRFGCAVRSSTWTNYVYCRTTAVCY